MTFAALCESLAQSFASGVWLESVSSELGHFDVMVVVNLDVDKFSNTIGIAKLKISLTAKLPAITCISLESSGGTGEVRVKSEIAFAGNVVDSLIEVLLTGKMAPGKLLQLLYQEWRSLSLLRRDVGRATCHDNDQLAR